MRRILALGQREFLADRARSCSRRIRRPHHFTVLRNRVFAFQNLNHDRRGRHERAKLAVKTTLGVFGIECTGLCGRQMNALGGDDAQAGILELGNDLAGQVALGGVGLDDRQRALDGHSYSVRLGTTGCRNGTGGS